LKHIVIRPVTAKIIFKTIASKYGVKKFNNQHIGIVNSLIKRYGAKQVFDFIQYIPEESEDPIYALRNIMLESETGALFEDVYRKLHEKTRF